jgi:hypothetical protein
MLSPKQRLAIFLHIGGYSNTEMSAQIGVHPTTIRRWMRDPEFAQELKVETEHAMARSRAQAQAAARRVADNACASARVAQSLLLNDRTDPKVLVQCAKVMLQSLGSLSRFLHEPVVVPLLESPDPSQSEDTPGETLREEEMMQAHVIRHKLEEEEKDGAEAKLNPAPKAEPVAVAQ